MIRTAFDIKIVVVAFLLTLGIAVVSGASQSEPTPSKELVQYIRDAKKRGVTEAKIKTQAVTVGWSAAAVDEALAFEKSGKPLPADPTPAPTMAASSPALNPVHPPEQAVPVVSAPEKLSATPAAEPPPAGVPLSRGTPDDYLIGAGDTLQITVWKEAEVSVPSGVVRPDGKISVPLIKEVQVAGLTLKQAEAVIAEGLGKFITDPNVTVGVSAIVSKKVYVIGAVRKEGTLPYTYGMTVMQALSEAGGLNDYAKRKKIYILRTESGREYRLDFNYDEVIRGQRMEQNVVLLPSDTVVIPH